MRPSRKVLLFAALAAGAGACSGGAIAKLVGVPAHYVYITPGAPQHVAGGDSVYLSIANQGFVTAYVERCGDAPALDFQVQQNGQWVEMGPAITCSTPSTPGPIALDPGQSIVIAHLYPNAGHYRVGVSAASKADLSDATEAWTVAFDTP